MSQEVLGVETNTQPMRIEIPGRKVEKVFRKLWNCGHVIGHWQRQERCGAGQRN